MSSEMNPFGFSGLPANIDWAQLLGSSGQGPVNWDIARFISAAMAGDADQQPRWSDIEDEYTQLVRAAEVQVTEYTGLSSPNLLTPVEVVSRARWCELHLDAFKPQMEALARRMADAQLPDQPGAEPFGNLMQVMSPLMMGAQTGMLVGFLSHNVLGRYDRHVPPPESGRLVFVAPNLEQAERELNVVPRDFKFWLAVHEVVRAVEYGQPGVRKAFIDLSVELVNSLEIDPEKLADLQNIDPSDPQSMQSMLEDPSALIESFASPEQQEIRDRMAAFLELIEGYAEHVTSFIGAKGIPSLDEIRDAIETKRIARGDMANMFEETLGFALLSEVSTVGRTFCDEITEREGVKALGRVFRDDESRPSLEELQNPDMWLDRTIGRRG